jgi:hypothetical protein
MLRISGRGPWAGGRALLMMGVSQRMAMYGRRTRRPAAGARDETIGFGAAVWGSPTVIAIPGCGVSLLRNSEANLLVCSVSPRRMGCSLGTL